MKKNFRMMLLGLMAMSSLSTFAVIDENARSINNVLYKLENRGTPGEGLVATVVGVNPASSNDEVKTIVISATVDGEKHTGYKVKYIASGWEKTAGNKNVSNVTETLIIDAANMGKDALDGDFSYLKKLKNLTIKENGNGDALKVFPTFAAPKIVETLDISGTIRKSAPTGDEITKVPAGAFYGGKLKSIKLPKTIASIGANAFYDCADLTAFEFGENLQSINNYAFKGTGLTAADLSKTKLTQISNGVFQDSKVATASLPKTVTSLQWYAFQNSPLATLTLEDPSTLKVIKTKALAYTKLTEFTLIANDPKKEVNIQTSAFEGCTKLKKFNFTGAAADDYDMDGDIDLVDFNAFIGCNAYVIITAPQEYVDWYLANYPSAPKNCKFEAKEAPIKVDGKIAVKNGFAKWFHNNKIIAVDAEKYKAFCVYVDNGSKKKDGTAYFQGLVRVDNRYYIWKSEHVIFQPVDPTVTEVEYEDMTLKTSIISDWSVVIDDIFTFQSDYTLADFQLGNSLAYGYDDTTPFDYYQGMDYYLYRLTNNNGVQFSLFTGDKMKGGYDDGTTDNCAKAQFFINSVRKPDASGRLNVIWLDEDGNVIGGDATAIEEVKTTQENGVSYNLAGQKVNNSYKGVVIKNGKKYMK